MLRNHYKAVVIGVSAGGLQALKILIPALPMAFALPVIIVQHTGEHSGSFMVDYLNQISAVNVKEAEDKEEIQGHHVYIAPAGYHLLIDHTKTFSLSVDERVNYCRPSVDVLFESASDVFKDTLIGIVLTGGNKDGAHGLKTIKKRGGRAIVQNPATAESDSMPKLALEMTPDAEIVNLEQIATYLVQLSKT